MTRQKWIHLGKRDYWQHRVAIVDGYVKCNVIIPMFLANHQEYSILSTPQIHQYQNKMTILKEEAYV